jgi:hypothetical protein
VAGRTRGSDHTGAAPDPVAMIAAIRTSSELDGVAQSLERICRAAVEYLGLLSAVTRLLANGESSGVVVAAEGTPEQLGDIEFDVGEGPGTSACATSRPVLVADLTGPAGDDWPGFRDAATECGVAAVYAFPLQFGAVVFGTLELFSERPGPLTREQLRVVRRMSEIGVEILLDGRSTNPDGSLSRGLARAVEHRADVAQAQGMIMVDLDVTIEEATARLRAHAFADGLSLSELARKVIDGYVLPSDEWPTAGAERR